MRFTKMQGCGNDYIYVNCFEEKIDDPAALAVRFTGVDTGNPHAAVFLEDNTVPLKLFAKSETTSADLRSYLADLDIEEPGRAMEQSERFPDGVNTEFICIVSRKEICMRVWKRGSGETLACGTGATASVYAGIMMGRLEDEVLVHLKGAILS